MPNGHLLAVRQRQLLYDIVYVWNIKMVQVNLFTKQK